MWHALDPSQMEADAQAEPDSAAYEREYKLPAAAYPLELHVASSLVHFLHPQHNNTIIGSFVAIQTPETCTSTNISTISSKSIRLGIPLSWTQ